jgi:putative FmdB family regulatory protein
MPCYDYCCGEHGMFEGLATVAASAQPQPCPRCGAPAARVIAAAPALLDLAPALRDAFARNERSRHEPRFRAGGEDDPHARCDGESSAAAGSQAILLADGSKVFPSQRPWMIGH